MEKLDAFGLEQSSKEKVGGPNQNDSNYIVIGVINDAYAIRTAFEKQREKEDFKQVTESIAHLVGRFPYKKNIL